MNRFFRELHETSRLLAWPTEFFGEILERSLNEIYIFDSQTLRFLHVNEGAKNNLGYSMAELVEMTPLDIKPEFNADSFARLIDPVRGRDDVLVFETVHARKDGSRYPVEVHLQHMRVNQAAVFTAIVLDITERKLAETELRHSYNDLDRRVQERTRSLRKLNTRLEQNERDLEEIFDAAPDAMVLVDADGLIQRANVRIKQLFGYTQRDLQGESVEVLMPERFRTKHVGHRNEFMGHPRVREMGATLELLGRRKDGTEFPIDVNLSPIEIGGQPMVSAAVRDYTEHRVIQDELRRAKEESDRATLTKSRFLATASHDLRQPLQSLGLYLSVLARRTADDKSLEVTDKMRRSLDVMGEMLDALLDISRFESGAIAPDIKTIRAQDLLDQVATDNAPVAQKKGLEFIAEPTSLMIRSDPVLLQRIIENFVTNAIRYTEAGSVTISCAEAGGQARIEVRDTGIGIPAESLEDIFDEYYQLDNSVRDRRQGLGIGLAIVKHIAHLLDHGLDVQSQPGDGSTFAVYVPIVQASAEQLVESAARPDHSARRSAVVLLIDDDTAIVDATAMLLEGEGFEVASAGSAGEALALCRQGVKPDVVVSDYRLPGPNGLEVIREVRDLVASPVPAILMTGDTATRKITDAELADCTVLHKPVDTNRLIDLISSCIA